MKIRSAKDVEKLDARLKEELGIDVSTYRNEEAVSNFTELLIFPKYVINWTLRPVLIAFLLYIIGFFFLDLVHVEYVLYALIGLVLFLLSGVFFGLLFLTWRMKKDLWGIIEYSLGIMKTAVSDINQVSKQIKPENRKEVLGLVFKGVIHIVTIPMLSKVISDKIPLLGGVVNSFVKKVLTLVSDKIKFDEVQLEEELQKKKDEPGALKVYANTLSSASTGLEKILNVTFGVAQFPIKTFFFISATFLFLFLYLIN